MQKLQIKVVDKLVNLYKSYRYKILYGGRASAKSTAVADYLIIQTFNQSKRVLCCRETQKAIKHSVHAVLKDRIYDLGLQNYFKINNEQITSVAGSEFIFKGLKDLTADSLKSMPKINHCWVEEAENVTETSWTKLIPTVRAPDGEISEILITFNPSNEENSTYQRFVVNTPENSFLCKINYYDNPFLPKVLLQEIEYDKLYNPDKFSHIWEGNCLKISNAVIFKNKFIVEEFDIDIKHGISYFSDDRIEYLYGLDYGFSTDPLALIEMFIYKNNLYINNELYIVGLDIDLIKETAINKMPNITNNKIYADNARPESTSYLHKNGLNIKSADKWKGSIEDGIERIKSFNNVIIHPRCKNAIYEFKKYSYKQDKNTGEIIPEIIDKDNHCLSGDTIVNTEYGDYFIKDLIDTNGNVYSYNEQTQKSELNKFSDVRITNDNAELYLIELENGKFFKATCSHPVLTQRGWIIVSDLLIDDSILCI